MNLVSISLVDLKPPDKNVRIHTEKQIKEFERSIKAFGQIRPIVIDENNTILVGNGLYTALKNMNIDKAEVYRITGLDNNQKKKLMLADNKIYSLGIDNLDTIDEFINDLKDDLDIPGFDKDILNQIVSEAEQVTEKVSEYGKLNDTEIHSIQNSRQRNELPNAENQDTSYNKMQASDSGLNSSQTKSNDGLDNTDYITSQSVIENEKYTICPKCGEKIWL